MEPSKHVIFVIVVALIVALNVAADCPDANGQGA